MFSQLCWACMKDAQGYLLQSTVSVWECSYAVVLIESFGGFRLGFFFFLSLDFVVSQYLMYG